MILEHAKQHYNEALEDRYIVFLVKVHGNMAKTRLPLLLGGTPM
jgi:hypothetical protein